MPGEQVEQEVDVLPSRLCRKTAEASAFELLPRLHAAEGDLAPLRYPDGRLRAQSLPFGWADDAFHAGLISAGLRPLRQHHQQVRTRGRVRVHVEGHVHT